MKQLFIASLFVAVLFTSCQQDEEITLSETGIVADYAGAGNCGFVIELDNGSKIQPLYYPDSFTFAEGQRVLVDYVELPNVISGCNLGTSCEIKSAEELSGAPYVDLYYYNYDSLKNDAVEIREVFVDGNCLQIKLSYSGGCQEHTIDLARIHPSCGTPPLPPPTFEIRHNANNDLCEAYFTKVFRFDLTPLKLAGEKELVFNAKLADGKFFTQTFKLFVEE
jgi:hypothetical protein